MQGVLKINGNDAFTTYGIVVKPNNYARLLTFPKPKDNGLTIDFADENGKDVVLDNPKYEATTLQLPFWITGSNEKLNLLVDEILAMEDKDDE